MTKRQQTKFPFDVGDLVCYRHGGNSGLVDRALILEHLTSITPLPKLTRKKQVFTIKYKVLWLNANKVVEWYHNNNDEKFHLIAGS